MITWIPAEMDKPKMHKSYDDLGDEYEQSDIVLVWTNNKDKPVSLGCLEDGKWFVDGFAGPVVLYWAFINGPDGRFLHMEYL